MTLKCRWCADSFPAGFDDFLHSHVQLDHPVQWREVARYLKPLDAKLKSLEEAASVISKGFSVYELFDFALTKSDALTIVSVEALEADI